MPIETCALALQNLNAGRNFVHRTKLSWTNPTLCAYEIKFKLISRGFPANVSYSVVRGELRYEENYQITAVSGRAYISHLNLNLAVLLSGFALACIGARIAYLQGLTDPPVWLDMILALFFMGGVLFSYWEARRESQSTGEVFLHVIERTLKATIPAEPTY